MAKEFDIRDRLAYWIQNLANKMGMWESRIYSENFEVGVQEWRILAVLAGNGEGTAREICETTLMDKGNVSRAIKKLVRTGRVREITDKKDKRSTVLVMTDKGYEIYGKIKELSDAREQKILASLTASERRSLPIILTKLNGVIEELLQETERS